MPKAVLVLVCALGAAPCQARQAFSIVDLSLGGTENLNRVGMHRWWKPSTGAAARAAFPLDAGFLEAGVRYLPLHARSPEVPSWSTLLVYAGWGLAWSPTSESRISGSVRAGVLRMRFEEETFAGVATENELSVGAAVRFEARPWTRTGFFVEAAAERTFTSLPVDLVHATVGIVARIGIPGWLREVLE